MDNFEEVIKNAPIDSLVQFFYKVEQIFDQKCESLIYMISIEEYQPLGLFKMSTMKLFYFIF